MVTIGNPWAYGDDPLPNDPDELVAQIKAAAAARRQLAIRHVWHCNCVGCIVRRGGQRIVRNDDDSAKDAA